MSTNFNREDSQAATTALSRRTFLQYSSFVAGNLLLLPLHSHAAKQAGPNTDLSKPWYQQPLRILQTVLRETDAREYDAQAVVNYMQEAGCNTLVVNAGGIVDFFRNPLPAANPNPYMGQRDILEEICRSCQAAGIRVIGRVDFRGVVPSVYQQHTDWFSVDADGNPMVLDYTRPKLHASCYKGYHRNEHAESFIRYLMKNYRLDGIWHNSIGVGGICYCQRCRQDYQQHAGQDIPDKRKADASALNSYMAWKTQAADQHMEHMKRTVKAFGEDKVYTAEVFSMFEAGDLIHSGIDLYNARDHFDFLVSVAFLTENSEHIQYEDLSYANTIVKFLKSMAPEKEAVILYGGNGTAHRYVMDPPVDLQVWLWEALSAGGRFWNCNFTGMHPNATHDRRNAFNNTAAYHFVKSHEQLLTQQVPVANIGIYYSRPTRLFYRQPAAEGEHFEDSIKGVESVLMEAHLPHNFVADDQLTAEKLSSYSLIILPNVRCMSDEEIGLLKNYVQEGGNLLATYASSLYDAQGRERPDFGLSEVFGCSYTGKKVNTRKDNYQYILKPKHALTAAVSQDTELLLNAGYTLLCRPSEEAEVVCTHVPTVHNQPPEKAWVERWSTEYPTLLEHTYGKGKVLYFANQPDRLSREIGHPDVRDMLLRGIRHLTSEKGFIETNAPASVHIGLTRSMQKPGEYVLSLVNTTSAPVRPLRQLITLQQIEVNLQLHETVLSAHQVLKAQGNCQVQQKDEGLQIRIDKLEDFCAIHLQMQV